MKFIHITDFHLVAPGTPLWGLDTRERAKRCLDDIAQWHDDAAFCVISGDLADKGEPSAYRWLAEQLKAFPLKTFLMVGNHDDRGGIGSAFPDLQCDSNGFIQYTHETDEGLFVFIDTHKGKVSEGAYCERRQAWLARTLESASNTPVWLFMHHPPFDVGIPYMDRIKLENPENFAKIISGHNNIRHIFFGHVHRAAYVQWRGISCTCLPGTNHQIPLKRESVGTPYSLEPPMYGVIEITQDQTTVHFDACLNREPIEMGKKA